LWITSFSGGFLSETPPPPPPHDTSATISCQLNCYSDYLDK